MKFTTKDHDRPSPEVTAPIIVMVIMYATGSLLPLSSSNIGLRLFFRPMFCPLRMLKTDAESVDAAVDAIRMDIGSENVIEIIADLERRNINRPVMTAVRTTPKVERTIPGKITGLMSENLVSIPPEKRIMLIATIPIACAYFTLLNSIPTPSDPNTIPTIRKRRRVGTPNLKLSLLTNILTTNRIEPINKKPSVIISIFYFYLSKVTLFFQ